MIVTSSALCFAQLDGRASADPFEGAATEGLSVRLVRLEGGLRRSPHRHPQSQEAIYVLSGSGVLWEEGIEQPVEPGDWALIDVGVPHATIPAAGLHGSAVLLPAPRSRRQRGTRGHTSLGSRGGGN